MTTKLTGTHKLKVKLLTDHHVLWSLSECLESHLDYLVACFILKESKILNWCQLFVQTFKQSQNVKQSLLKSNLVLINILTGRLTDPEWAFSSTFFSYALHAHYSWECCCLSTGSGIPWAVLQVDIQVCGVGYISRRWATLTSLTTAYIQLGTQGGSLSVSTDNSQEFIFHPWLCPHTPSMRCSIL